MSGFKIKRNIVAAFKGDDINRIINPDMLVNVLLYGSGREQQDAVDNDFFPWERLPSLLTSPDLNTGALRCLCSVSEMWDYSAVDFAGLLKFFQEKCQTEPGFDSDLRFLMEYLMDPATMKDRKPETGILSVDFVETVYALLPLNAFDDSAYLLTWVRFLVHPGMSDDFRNKVWMERKGDISAGFAKAGWFERSVVNCLIWKDAPPALMFMAFMHEPRRDEKVFDFEIYVSKWREGLIEGLQENFSVDHLDDVPTEWLRELAISLLKEDR